MRRLAFAALFISLVLAFSGCSMNKAVSKINIQLTKVNVTHMDNEGLQATLYLQVTNPNWFSLTVSDFSYTAYISGSEIAHGTTDTEIKIPGNGSAQAELPMTVTYGDLKDKLQDILRGGLEYRVVGEAGFKTWLGRYAVQFDTGNKPLKRPGKHGKDKKKAETPVTDTGDVR